MLRYPQAVLNRPLCLRATIYEIATAQVPSTEPMSNHSSPARCRHTWVPSHGIFFSEVGSASTAQRIHSAPRPQDPDHDCSGRALVKPGSESAPEQYALARTIYKSLCALTTQPISAFGRGVLDFQYSLLAPLQILPQWVFPLDQKRRGGNWHYNFDSVREDVLEEGIADIIFEDSEYKTPPAPREPDLTQKCEGVQRSFLVQSSLIPTVRGSALPRGARAISQKAGFLPRGSKDGQGDQSLTSTGGISCDARGSEIGDVESEYQIPEAKLREAMLASRTTKAAYWRYSLYEKEGHKVRVHYCKSLETTERVAKLFLDQGVLGFDIEWKPQASASDGIKKNVSLIQIASEERVALFHIAKYTKDDVQSLVAPTLKYIMENPGITKVGVGVKADCTRLRRYLAIQAAGIFELSHLYKLLKFSTGDLRKVDKRLIALAQQVEEHLQLPLWKGEVRASTWNQDLNYEQIQYAASDSYAGLQLFNVLEAKRKSLSPTPPRPEHAELNLPIRTASGESVTLAEDTED